MKLEMIHFEFSAFPDISRKLFSSSAKYEFVKIAAIKICIFVHIILSANVGGLFSSLLIKH